MLALPGWRVVVRREGGQWLGLMDRLDRPLRRAVDVFGCDIDEFMTSVHAQIVIQVGFDTYHDVLAHPDFPDRLRIEWVGVELEEVDPERARIWRRREGRSQRPA